MHNIVRASFNEVIPSESVWDWGSFCVEPEPSATRQVGVGVIIFPPVDLDPAAITNLMDSDKTMGAPVVMNSPNGEFTMVYNKLKEPGAPSDGAGQEIARATQQLLGSMGLASQIAQTEAIIAVTSPR